jgi:hypothetical protein
MTRIMDLDGVEIEHLLGATAGPLVKIRCLSAKTILLGQMTPNEARRIASHLHESAARAEYEADLFNIMRAEGWADHEMGLILHMVRTGEARRHQGDTTDDNDT